MKRERRYIVLKIKDIEKHLSIREQNELYEICDHIERLRSSIGGKKPLECVVVESDWPEYEPTWKAIEARMDGVNPNKLAEFGIFAVHGILPKDIKVTEEMLLNSSEIYDVVKAVQPAMIADRQKVEIINE